MYLISKQFAFSASHMLHGLPDGHPCGRLHGHNYTVEVVLAANGLDERGFVMDYGALKPFQDWIDEHLDHRHLNDVLVTGQNPTSEVLAQALFGVVWTLFTGIRIVSVRVAETPKTWAEFRPEPLGIYPHAFIPSLMAEANAASREVRPFEEMED